MTTVTLITIISVKVVGVNALCVDRA